MSREGRTTKNIVIIGREPVSDYIATILTLLNEDIDEVVIRAMGRDISKAVDVVEILRNRFLPGRVIVKEIKIGSQTITRPAASQSRVSFIEIKLGKIGLSDRTVDKTNDFIHKEEQEINIPITEWDKLTETQRLKFAKKLMETIKPKELILTPGSVKNINNDITIKIDNQGRIIILFKNTGE